MKKIKKTLWKKAAAIALALALVLGAVPTGAFQTQAAIPEDVTAPSVEAMADQTDWTKGEVTITGTVSDAESGVAKVYYQKGEETKVEVPVFDAGTGAYSVTIAAQAYAGDYKIICEDNDGNIGEKIVAVKMDNVAPTLSEVKANMDWAAEHWTKGKVVVTGQASDDLSEVASVTWKKQSDNTTGTATLEDSGKFSFEIPAQNYEGNYIVTCTDKAGNVSAESTVAVKMDIDKCIVSTCTADKTDWTNGKVVVSGTVTDNLSGVSTIKYKKEGAGTNTVIGHNNGSYSFEIPAQDYNGNYIVICTDKAGNTLEYSVPVKMDATAPIVNEAKANNEDWTNDKVVISGKVSDALSGVVSVSYKRADEENAETVTPNAEGEYSFELPAQAYKGDYVITCKDAAGNVSEEVKVAVKMDNKAPEVEGNPNIWKKIVYEVTFGLFYKDDQEMIIDSEDNLSGIKTIETAEKHVKEGETIDQQVLDELSWEALYTATEAEQTEVLDQRDPIPAEDKNIIYCVKVTDYAGNVSYLTSDGMIFDVTDPKGEITVDTEKKMVYPTGGVTPSATVPGTSIPLYGIEAVGDDGLIEFDVRVSDRNLGENTERILSSGIKSVAYNVYMKGSVHLDYHLARSQDLYSFTGPGANLVDEKVGIELEEWNGRFKEIELNVTDYAGNTVSDTFELALDLNKPRIEEAEANIKTWTNSEVIISGKVSDESFGVASVTCKKENEDVIQTVMPNEQGEYSFTIEAQDYVGPYIITCTDYAGNLSDEMPVQVWMDNIAPKVTAERDFWKEIVYEVTLGLFYKDSQEIVISSTDDLSGIKTIDRAEKSVALNEEITLDVLKELDWTNIYTENHDMRKASEVKDTITAENKNIIYCVKVTDYAGNVSYLTSDGLIFDVTDPKGEVTIDTEKKMVYPVGGVIPTATVKNTDIPLYGIEAVGTDGTVEFDVHISESKLGENPEILQSGITKVDYKIEAYNAETDAYDITKTGTLVENESLEKYEETSCIKVDAEKFNSNSVIVTVTATDRAGNEASDSFEIGIDNTCPVVTEAQANNVDWTNADVEITGKVSDVPSGVQKVTCKRDGSSEEEVVEFNEEEGTFKVVVEAQTYKGDYILTCTDYAGNVSEEVKVAVKMDNTVPTVTAERDIWKEIVYKVTFGLFYKEDQTMVINSADDLSGIKTIDRFEKSVALDEEITLDVLKGLDWTNIHTESEAEELGGVNKRDTITANNKNIIYCVKVTDYAGNVSYLTSDGLIFDVTEPKGEILVDTENKMVYPAGGVVPKISVEKAAIPIKKNTNVERTIPLYGIEAVGTDGTVEFDVHISESKLGENSEILQSGIAKVDYKIEAYNAETDAYDITKTGTLVENESLEKYEETSCIKVDAEKFNSNSVIVTVTATDRAGNEATDSFEIAIDITAPTIEVSYENDPKPVAEANDKGYYVESRKAIIKYTERNWNQDAAVKTTERELVKAIDINGDYVDSYTIEWDLEIKDRQNRVSDTDTYVATITFTTTKDSGADANYTINPEYTDVAGNVGEVSVAEGTKHPYKFTIDTVNPEIIDVQIGEENDGHKTFVQKIVDVLHELTFHYFQKNATVTVTIKDETAGVSKFDYEGILDEGVSTKNKPVEFTVIDKVVENASELAEGEVAIVQQSDKSEFVVTFHIPKEALTDENSFRGRLIVNAHDYAKNVSVEEEDEGNTFPTSRIVVDKIAPVGQVIFEQPVKEVNGVSYYDKDFKATVIIDEANFYAEDVEIMVNGAKVVPTDWVQDGDIWISHVSFTAENDYVMTVNYTDRSGNEMVEYKSNQKTLDKTNPVITVSNIKHQSANNQETIGFTLTVTDKNIVDSDIRPAVVAVVREGTSPNYTYVNKTIPLGSPSVSVNAQGETVYTYTVSNLEIDGYYSLRCTATDHANHSVSNISVASNANRGVQVETVNFSVNRDGSVFWIETEHTNAKGETVRNQLNNAYVNGEVLVKIHELNVDRVNDLTEEDKRTVLTLNDGSESRTIELVDKAYADGNYDKNIQKGSGGWYETIYTLDNKMFAKDGTYSLNVLTYDMAQNSNVNTKSEEGTIKFVVDRTKPVITANVKSKQIIDASEYTIEFKIAEVNLDESTIVAKLNGKEVEYTKSGDNTYQFKVKDLLNDNITITAKDTAGNSSEKFVINKLTVSADWYVRWFANQPLFWGTIGGTVGLLGLFVFIVLKKRREEA